MANEFERRITIEAPAEDVFDYISDLERHCEWATNPLSIQLDQRGPIQVGTTFRAEATIMGRRTNDIGRVTRSVRPSRFVYETEGAAGTVVNWFDIHPDGDRCTVAKGSRNTRLSTFSKLMIPVLRVMAPRWYDRNLRAIKERIETQRTQAA